MGIYLDYNASAPIDHRVLDYMVDVYKNNYGNADSRTHSYGDAARSVVENARKSVAELVGCRTDEVFFTSGATESNNIALLGLHDYANDNKKKHVVTTSIEHKAVLETAHFMEKNGYSVDFVDPNQDGVVSAEEIAGRVCPETLLVSVMHVNNETGAIQPVERIGEQLSDRDVLFHVDITQSCGKLIDEIRSIKCDMLSLSAHKLAGPQGVGALILKRKKYKRPPIKAIMHGGQQEKGIRPGTVPVALVAGFGKACEIAQKDSRENEKKCNEIKETFIRLLNESGLEYTLNGTVDNTLFNTLNVRIHGVSSEALMIAGRNYCGISNGSACTSKDYAPSYVLKAMGLSDDHIRESLRISWGNQDVSVVGKEFNNLLTIAKGIK